MKHRFLSFLSLMLLCSLLLTTLGPCLADSESDELPVLDAKAVVLMDASGGDLLYSMNPDTPLYIAGLTVMMTALLTAEAVDRQEIAYSDTVTASEYLRNDIPSDANTQNILPGEKMTVQNLLYCALIGGGSDACNVLGEYISGSASAFVNRMNQRARDLGCRNTNFANCHGLPNDSHYSTARDMALIASAFVSHGELMDIANTISREIPATNLSGARKISNSNYLLRTDYTRYYYSLACGIKNSFTEDAGFCLASSLKTDDSYVVSIVLGCRTVETDSGFNDIQSFTQTKKLFQWFNSRYSLRDVVSAIEPIAEVPVELGEGTDTVVVCSDTPLSLFLPNDLVISEHYFRSIRIYSQEPGAEPLTAPISRGQVLGEMTVTTDSGSVYGPYQLIANTDVTLSKVELMRQRFRSMLHSGSVKFILIAVILIMVLYIAFVTAYRLRRKKLKQAMRAEREASEKKDE